MPEPRTLTNEDIFLHAEEDGLEYVITHKFSVGQAEDPHTRMLWSAAQLAMEELETYLHQFAPSGYFEPGYLGHHRPGHVREPAARLAPWPFE